MENKHGPMPEVETGELPDDFCSEESRKIFNKDLELLTRRKHYDVSGLRSVEDQLNDMINSNKKSDENVPKTANE